MKSIILNTKAIYTPQFIDSDSTDTFSVGITSSLFPQEAKTPEPEPQQTPEPQTPEPVRRNKPSSRVSVQPIFTAPNHKLQLRKALKPLLEASYKPIENAESVALKYGYVLDRKLSVENTYVYVSTQTGFPLVVHRGSVSATDWLLEDVLIATGITSAFNNSPRLALARDITQKTEAKYGLPTDAFGHSLGGRVAEHSGANGYIMTYNKAVGLFDARTQVSKNQIDYRSPKDIVSALSVFQPRETGAHIRHIEDTGIINSHSVEALPKVASERRQ